jgi:hypothetical protein
MHDLPCGEEEDCRAARPRHPVADAAACTHRLARLSKQCACVLTHVDNHPRAAGRFLRSVQGPEGDKMSGAGGHVASSMMFKMLRVSRRSACAMPALAVSPGNREMRFCQKDADSATSPETAPTA